MHTNLGMVLVMSGQGDLANGPCGLTKTKYKIEVFLILYFVFCAISYLVERQSTKNALF